MAALTIRKDRTPVMLRKLAKAEEDARVGRRMLAIANALDGMSREAAAQAAGMDRQTLRDWVIRYNENGIDGLLDRWDGGRPPRLEADELAELYAIVMAGPDPEIDGVCAFTREDLVRICEKRFDKTMTTRHPRIRVSEYPGPRDCKARAASDPGYFAYAKFRDDGW